jgi:flagellar basal-body rod modification protein FlgD
VRTLTPSGGDKGTYKVTWDGKNTDGAVAANGNYSLRINATNADGDKITAGLLTYGKVAEVTNDNGQVGLILADGRQAKFEDSYGVRVVN